LYTIRKAFSANTRSVSFKTCEIPSRYKITLPVSISGFTPQSFAGGTGVFDPFLVLFFVASNTAIVITPTSTIRTAMCIPTFRRVIAPKFSVAVILFLLWLDVSVTEAVL
jgi:hypothetical protein